jgi:hypothetical protein
VASGPFPATVTVAHAAERGSSITNKPNGDSPKWRASFGPTLRIAACAVPPTSGRYEGTICRHNASKGSRYAMVS